MSLLHCHCRCSEYSLTIRVLNFDKLHCVLKDLFIDKRKVIPFFCPTVMTTTMVMVKTDVLICNFVILITYLHVDN